MTIINLHRIVPISNNCSARRGHCHFKSDTLPSDLIFQHRYRLIEIRLTRRGIQPGRVQIAVTQ